MAKEVPASGSFSILQLIREYIPEAIEGLDTSVESDDHFMAGVFASYYQKRIDAADVKGVKACIAMANDARLYSNASTRDAMETTAFISIHDEGPAYAVPFMAALTGAALGSYEATIARWTSQF